MVAHSERAGESAELPLVGYRGRSSILPAFHHSLPLFSRVLGTETQARRLIDHTNDKCYNIENDTVYSNEARQAGSGGG